MAHRLTALAGIALLTIACSQGTIAELPRGPASIAGRVTVVTRAKATIGAIRVEAIPGDSAGSAKAQVLITHGTYILGNTGQASDLDALAVGQWVRVWFNGPVAESYPVQAVAGTVAIDSMPP